jgi:hypothetical protein
LWWEIGCVGFEEKAVYRHLPDDVLEERVAGICCCTTECYVPAVSDTALGSCLVTSEAMHDYGGHTADFELVEHLRIGVASVDDNG